MRTLNSLALRFENNTLSLLNQQKLPMIEEWLICHSPIEMVEFIQALSVRGAPLIGISAALALAHYVEKGASQSEIKTAALKLMSARPTAVNLSYCILKQLEAYETEQDPQAIIDVAECLFEEDAKMSERISSRGAEIIQPGESILTHCNAGGLVTTGMGTALGVIMMAHGLGKNVHVYVDETRPLLQGGRLTTWELFRAGIPHTLICDNMAASLMRDGKIQRVIVGADRIASNGDTANKIGTYSLAALAHLHGIPFHIAAPKTTFDWNCPSGKEIVIEERAEDEVRGASGAFGNVAWALAESKTYNPAFDVTPSKYITSFMTDIGVFTEINEMYEHLFLRS